MLIDKNILMACGISFALHGVIFGMSGFSIMPPEQEIMPEEITVNIKIEKPALLPKIRNLGETKKFKKIEQTPQKSFEKKQETFDASLLHEVRKLPKNDPGSEPTKTMINPELPDNSLKQKIEKISEEKINTLHPDEEAMLDFHNMIKQKIEEARRYPLWAKKKEIQGVTRISFTVLPDGTCRDIKVAGSSGSEILDQEALETLKRAQPFPSVPEKISSSPLSLEVGIVFSLQQNGE